jgi:hypothetical protein
MILVLLMNVEMMMMLMMNVEMMMLLLMMLLIHHAVVAAVVKTLDTWHRWEGVAGQYTGIVVDEAHVVVEVADTLAWRMTNYCIVMIE